MSLRCQRQLRQTPDRTRWGGVFRLIRRPVRANAARLQPKGAEQVGNFSRQEGRHRYGRPPDPTSPELITRSDLFQVKPTSTLTTLGTTFIERSTFLLTKCSTAVRRMPFSLAMVGQPTIDWREFTIPSPWKHSPGAAALWGANGSIRGIASRRSAMRNVLFHDTSGCDRYLENFQRTRVHLVGCFLVTAR